MSASASSASSSTAAAVAKASVSAIVRRLKSYGKLSGGPHQTAAVYGRAALRPPYHYFPTIVAKGRILDPLPRGYTVYPGIRVAYKPGQVSRHAGRKGGKVPNKRTRTTKGPTGACAINALIQALTHFGGPGFIRKLGASLKYDCLAPKDGQKPTKQHRFMSGIFQTMSIMRAYQGPVTRRVPLALLRLLLKLKPDCNMYCFHDLWNAFCDLAFSPMAAADRPFVRLAIDRNFAGASFDMADFLRRHLGALPAKPDFVAVDLAIKHPRGRVRPFTVENGVLVPIDGHLYVLNVIVRHLGPSAKEGHYVAHVHDMIKGKWLTFDNARVYDKGLPAKIDNQVKTEELFTYSRLGPSEWAMVDDQAEQQQQEQQQEQEQEQQVGVSA